MSHLKKNGLQVLFIIVQEKPEGKNVKSTRHQLCIAFYYSISSITKINHKNLL